MRTPRRTCRSQRCLRHAEHAFGRSYRARICRPARKARWVRASLGNVLLFFCPTLLHRFRELLPARSSEPATSLGRRGLTGSVSHTPLGPAIYARFSLSRVEPVPRRTILGGRRSPESESSPSKSA